MRPLREAIETALNLDSISRDEIKTDIKAMQESPTKAEKQAVAGKYGISSNKAAEIEKALRQILVERHKTKSPNDWTEEDFQDWWSFYNAPTSAVVLKKALAGESVEWVKFVRDTFEKTLAQKYIKGDYYVRAANSFRKYTTGLINDATNKTDVNRIALIEDLMEKTKEFHDNHIENVRGWAEQTFEDAKLRKDWEIADYMAYYGTVDREAIKQALLKANGIAIHMKIDYKLMEYFSADSKEYNPKKTVEIWYNKIKPNTVKVAVGHRMRMSMEEIEEDRFSDIPTINALKIRSNVQMIGAESDWNKKKYIEKQVQMAEDKYRADIELVADRVRKMKMDEKSIEVLSQQDDPKAFDMVLTDGQKQVRARSIYAAQFSEKVSPHYRFIIT